MVLWKRIGTIKGCNHDYTVTVTNNTAFISDEQEWGWQFPCSMLASKSTVIALAFSMLKRFGEI